MELKNESMKKQHQKYMASILDMPCQKCGMPTNGEGCRSCGHGLEEPDNQYDRLRSILEIEFRGYLNDNLGPEEINCIDRIMEFFNMEQQFGG
jgi:hypothetical protein